MLYILCSCGQANFARGRNLTFESLNAQSFNENSICLLVAKFLSLKYEKKKKKAKEHFSLLPADS